MIPCGLYEEKFSSNNDLTDHLEGHKSRILKESEIKSEHDSDQDSYEGSLILDCVKEEEQLQGHEEETQNGKGESSSAETFVCPKCPYKTMSKRYFKEHMDRKHLNKFKCDQCPKRYPFKGRLAYHIREKHMKDDGKPKLPEDEFFRITRNGEGYRKLYKCLECTYQTEIKSHIYRHIRSVHRKRLGEPNNSKGMVNDNDEGDRDSSSEIFMCSKCSFKSTSTRKFKVHMNVMHLNKFKCEHCPKRFLSDGRLRNHIRENHEERDKPLLPEDEFLRRNEKGNGKPNRKRYECLKCTFKTDDRTHIYRHIRGIHRNLLEELYKSKGMVLDNDAGYHKCTKCDFKTLHRFNLRTHIKIVHQKGRDYVCDLCKEVYPIKGYLKRHMKMVHISSESSKLHKFSIEKNQMKRRVKVVHRKKIQRFTCDLCQKQSLKKNGLQRHIEKVHLKMKKIVNCNGDSNCSFRTTNKHELGRHIRRVHQKIQGVSCKNCGQWYSSPSSLSTHKRKHMEGGSIINRLTCDLCQKTFKTRQSIHIHMRKKHLSGLDSRENICEDKFSPNGELKEHLEGYKSQILQESEIKSEQESDQDSYEGNLIMDFVKEEEQLQSSSEILWCSKCPFKTINKEHFKRHMNEVHLNKNKCDHCPRKFSSKMCLANHIRDKHMREEDNPKLLEDGFHCVKKHKKENRNKYIKKVRQERRNNVCDLCTRSYSSKEYLLKHIKFIHFKAEPSDLHNCSICSYKTYNKSSLKKHMNSVHLKIRRFTCDLCQIQYSTKFELQRHFGIVHLKKMLRCDGDSNCSFRTTDRYKLSRHIRRVHQKIQGVNCETCGNWYCSREGLYKHKRKHTEGESIINRLTCDLCQKTYKKKDYLNKHMKKTHLKEIPEKTSTTPSRIIKSE